MHAKDFAKAVNLLVEQGYDGFRRAVPYLLGIEVGVGAMVLAASAGVGVLITTVPSLETALKAIGSAYLLYLAYQVAGSPAVHETHIGRPPGLWSSVAFQFVNPKAWVFVLTAVGAFRPSGVDVAVASVLMTLVVVAVILPSASAWAVGGQALRRFVTSPRRHRAVSVGLAVVLVAMVAVVWL